MPTMPNLYGLNLQEAEQALTLAGVLNPSALGYFGAWPISAQWVAPPSAQSLPPGFVIGQSIGVGSAAAVNAAVQLTMIQYPMGVSYP